MNIRPFPTLIVLVVSSLLAVSVALAANVVQDGGFEGSVGGDSPAWIEGSLNFGTPLCDTASCGTGSGSAGPHSGSWWAWFGGISGASEIGSISQTFTIPAGSSFLEFYLWAGRDNGLPGSLVVDIDGTTVFAVNNPYAGFTAGYQLVSVNVSSFADGASHTLTFTGTTTAAIGPTNINVDDVSLQSSASGSRRAVLRPSFTDGRINNWDTGAPVAIYGVDYGGGQLGLHIYRVSPDSRGYIVLEVKPDQIASVPEQPDHNTLIAQTDDGWVTLYRLQGGKFQVNAGPDFEGKTYVFIFGQLFANAGTTTFNLNPNSGGGDRH